MAKDLLDKTGLTYLATKFQEWCEGLFVKKDTEYKDVYSSDRGVKVSIGGTIGSPVISVETTVGEISENNSSVVSGDMVKAYVDANKGVNTVFKAQTSSSNAVNGLVPAPTSANTQKYLRGDGTWQTPVSVINNLSSTSTTGALSAAQGKILNEKFGIGVYDLGAFYNYPDGCLIELGELAVATMVTIHITGYAYYSHKPFNSMFVFYDWVNNGTKAREIINYGGINLGVPLGFMKVYHYNNKIYVWIKQTGDYQTLSFRLHSNRTDLTPTVTNSSVHTSGVTLLTEIEPESPLAASTESSDGLMESTDKKNLNTIKKWYDNIVGVDEDKVINKWDEIVSFLSGIPEGDTLDGLIEAVKTQVGDLKADIEDGTVKAKEATTLGHETIGSTTKPIYLTSGVATPCTYTLGTSVPSDAKFTDTNTTYSFAGGTNKFTVTPSGGAAQEVSVTPSITNNVTYSGTLTSGQVTVLDGTAGKIKASGYTIAKSVPSDAVFTDTHYTAKNVVSNSANATANKSATNGDVHINLVENNTCRSGIKIVGSGATQVVSDEWGNITITSDDTNTTYVAMTGATSTANGKGGLVPKPLYGSENAFLRGDGTWSYRINEFGYTGDINIGTSFSNATGWFRIARARYLRSTPSVFRVAIYRTYSYAVPEAYVFDVCTSYNTYDPISITQVAGQASTVEGNKLIDKIRVTRDTSSPDTIVYFDFHVNLSKTRNQFFWYVIGNAESYTSSAVVRNPTITSTTEAYEFTTVNGFKTNGDIYEGDSSLSSKYIQTTKSISTSAANKGVQVKLGGTVGSPTLTVTTTTGGVASNNTGVVSGAEVKSYVDTYAASTATFKAATSSSSAVNGLVPAPSSANATKFLKGNGTWATPTDTTYDAATTSSDGLMSASDKKKLDGIANSANAYSLPNATSTTLGGVKIGSNISVNGGTISLTKSNVTSALGYTPPTSDTNTTYSAGSGLSLSGTSFSLKTGYTTSGKNYAVQLDSSGNPYVNVPWTDTDTDTTYNVVTSSVAGLAPKIGTAAAATIGTQSTEWVLTSTSGGTPTWRKLPANAFNNTTYNVATTSANGLMSSADKKKLDGALSSSENVSLSEGKTIEVNNYGSRFYTLSGSGLKMRLTAETGGWYLNPFILSTPTITCNLLGVYGNKNDLTYIYIGGTYSVPWLKFTYADHAATFETQPKVGSSEYLTKSSTVKNISVVNSLPSSPDSNTLYIIK